MEISGDMRVFIRAMFRSVAETLQEEYPNVTIPEIKRVLQEILEISI